MPSRLSLRGTRSWSVRAPRGWMRNSERSRGFLPSRSATLFQRDTRPCGRQWTRLHPHCGCNRAATELQQSCNRAHPHCGSTSVRQRFRTCMRGSLFECNSRLCHRSRTYIPTLSLMQPVTSTTRATQRPRVRLPAGRRTRSEQQLQQDRQGRREATTCLTRKSTFLE